VDPYRLTNIIRPSSIRHEEIKRKRIDPVRLVYPI
jgi:hypothetical protein